MTDANNQINDVLSKLTALGTVLIPVRRSHTHHSLRTCTELTFGSLVRQMNLITGLWGMNVHVPGQEVENLHWFFGVRFSFAYAFLSPSVPEE